MTATRPTSVETIAIIGAGQTGGQAAATLRASGYEGRLILIGDENHAPYQRPPLSKKYLSGNIEADRLALFPQRYYADNAIEMVLGSAVTALDADARSLRLADGRTIAFDRALLATGSRSRSLPIPGADLEGVFALRSIRDVDRLRPYVERGGRLVVIGGGYIGLEVAAITSGLGLDIHVIEAADRVMARTATETVSRFFQGLHERAGVTFHLGAGVRAITRDPSGRLAVTTTVDVQPADCVLVGIGGQPNVEIAADAGLAVDDGIVVDEFCRTTAAGIFAAGDCANFPSPLYGRRIRLESVQNAIDQAKAAALAMIGKPEAYDPVPWFWSDQHDVKYQIAGLCQGADRHIVRGDPATGSFAVAHLQGGRLIALDAINRPRDYMLARRLIPERRAADEARLADPDVSLDKTFV